MALVAPVENGKIVETASQTSVSKAAKSSSGMDKEAFLQLLVAQMKYQDPLEPTDNTEYISQLATFSQLEETQNMQASLQEMEANSLVGKQVVLRVTSSATGETSDVTGTVDSVIHENNKTYLMVNNNLYSIDDLYSVMDDSYMDAISLAKSFSLAIASLPSADELTLDNAGTLTNLRKAYDSMTSYQKSFIKQSDIDKLVKLEEKMKQLQAAAGENGDKTEGNGGTEDKKDTEETGKAEYTTEGY